MRGDGLVVVVLGCLDGAERVVPVGFQGVGDEPVVGVDREVAAPREVGVVPGPLDVVDGAAYRLARRGFPARLGR